MKRLTDFADCAGCASKLGPDTLTEILSGLPRQSDPRVLVDFRTSDDAGVFAWSAGRGLVHTVDFFTPVVDDPYTFGQIAAANALSDVYAMGGEPRTALAIAGFPKNELPHDVINAIFRGGFDKLNEAGVALLGGHTISDPEIKFGYAVTGEVDPARMWTNAAAAAGDVLILTKPLGTGIIVRAEKFGRAQPEQLRGAVDSMTALNREAAAAAAGLPDGMIHACTDITGFGLAGHACEMAAASGVTIDIDTSSLPILAGAAELAAENLPCGGRTNARHFGGRLLVEPDVPEAIHLVCLDPQTSGGLLFAVDKSAAGYVIGQMTERGVSVILVGSVDAPGESGALVRLK